jgi:hypothetical protein
MQPDANGWMLIDKNTPKDGVTEILLCENGERFIGMRPFGCPDYAAMDSSGSACYPEYWQPLPELPIVYEVTK